MWLIFGAMQFEHLFTEQRTGSSGPKPSERSGFQRDYDRLIFSSAFRRLQNKTQVFPLPGTAFVHNRLTHSLEVASVGRSLGKIVGSVIASSFKGSNEEAYEFYRYELSNVIAAACLAHDIGNPAFGHSGEKAISAYFVRHADSTVGGRTLRSHFSEAEWQDLTSFEGNANAVRILTHAFKGRFRGGFGLTYTTIASILKYPCESLASDTDYRHRKKYGFFQSERPVVEEVMTKLGVPQESHTPLIFARHPFVYLTEAADDICYSIIDMEDAHRLNILSSAVVSDAFLALIADIRPDDVSKAAGYYRDIKDPNEGIAFLRARVINWLTQRCAELFLDARETILSGRCNHALTDVIAAGGQGLRQIQEISVKSIYNHSTVVQIEIAGFNVMSELLQLIVPALLADNPDPMQKKLLQLFPFQFTEFSEAASPYIKVQNALDLVSGMTDEYATEMYRRLKGITIPNH